MNRGLTIAVAISLALNLFILGAGATLLTLRADLFRTPPASTAPLATVTVAGAPAAAAVAANNPAAVIRDLGVDQREAMAAAVGVRQPKIVPLRKASREAKNEAADLLSAPTVDRAALSAALARARAADIAARAENEEAVIVQVAAGLSPAERAEVADTIRPKDPQARPKRARAQAGK